MAIVKDLESLKDLIQRVRKAQEEFATFDQERVDKIFRKVAQKMKELHWQIWQWLKLEWELWKIKL